MGISADDGALVGFGQTGTINGIYQLYIQDNGAGPNWVFVGVTNLTPTFPTNTIPVAVIVYDGVGRISQVIDYRSSYLSSVPTYATGASENIASPTLRSGFVNNFYVPRQTAISAQIPPDVNLPYSSFALGAGSVVISGNVITIPTTVFTSTTVPPVNGNPIYNYYGSLKPGQITQIYVTSTGALATQTAVTSGVFPANVLAVAEITVDSASLIRNIFDWRPSYI